MQNRPELQTVLENILGSRNVYFQPSSNIQLRYPAIVYSRRTLKPIFANNKVYITLPEYEVTVIDKNPDSEYVAGVSQLPGCIHERHFKADNLNHDVFRLHHK